MSPAFDPVTGRPTGVTRNRSDRRASTSPRSARGRGLPTGTVPDDRRDRRGRRRRADRRGTRSGRVIAVGGLLLGGALITVAVLPGHADPAPSASTPTAPAPSTTRTTTTTATTTTTTTTTAAEPVGPGWGSRTGVLRLNGSPEYDVSYDIPPGWHTQANSTTVDYHGTDFLELDAATTGPAATCSAEQPEGAGAVVDPEPGTGLGTLAVRTTRHLAIGLFGTDQDASVPRSTPVSGSGWTGQQVVATVRANVVGCPVTGGTVVVIALHPDGDATHTIVVCAYSSADDPESTSAAALTRVVTSLRIG